MGHEIHAAQIPDGGSQHSVCCRACAHPEFTAAGSETVAFTAALSFASKQRDCWGEFRTDTHDHAR